LPGKIEQGFGRGGTESVQYSPAKPLREIMEAYHGGRRIDYKNIQQILLAWT